MATNEFDIIGTLDTKQIQQGAKKIEQGFKNLGNKIDDNAQRVNKFGNAIKTVAKASVALFAIDKIVEFGRKVVDTRGEMQRYSAVLENTLGNAQAAAAAQELITKEAAKSNFSVRELTGSYVKLANQGLLATSDQLVKLQDLANSTGKGFDQLAEAIIDAQTGEFERLKEFGIRASKQGDQVEFAFKGVKTQVDFTSDSIQAYLIGLGEVEGVTGSTAAISKTFEGRISNLGDQFLTFLNKTGQKLEPFINLLITGLSKGLDILSTALNSTISGLVATINYFITLYNESTIFRQSIQILKQTFVSFFELLKTGFDQIINGFSTLGSIISLVLSGEFEKVGAVFTSFTENSIERWATFGTEAANAFGEAFEVDMRSQVEQVVLGTGEVIKSATFDYQSFLNKQSENRKKRDEADAKKRKKIALGEAKLQKDIRTTNQLAEAKSAREGLAIVLKAETSEAVAGLISSILKTVPFPFNLLVAAGAQGLVNGLFRNIQGFQDGGIIGGNSFSGDRTPILANAGERVLNIPQQEFVVGSQRRLQQQMAMMAKNQQELLEIIQENQSSGDSIEITTNALASDYVDIYNQGVQDQNLARLTSG
ncbi:MAG: hypothetical protein ACRBG0_27735 [Lewinella sp.]|uniref:hypothetical protein n=1 Tax=Lewinella sp. TaxID=2004506 RepID=UPI003D6A870C